MGHGSAPSPEPSVPRSREAAYFAAMLRAVSRSSSQPTSLTRGRPRGSPRPRSSASIASQPAYVTCSTPRAASNSSTVSAVAAGSPAELDDLLALAIAYFEEALAEPPEDLAATHADIGALVRHVGVRTADPSRAAAVQEAVDAIDDGLAADVVVSRLALCLSEAEEPVARLTRRATV